MPSIYVLSNRSESRDRPEGLCALAIDSKSTVGRRVSFGASDEDENERHHFLLTVDMRPREREWMDSGRTPDFVT